METVHFTELADYAVKGKVERGLIYYYCWPKIGQHYHEWFPVTSDDEWFQPSCQVAPRLAASNLITLPVWCIDPRFRYHQNDQDSYWNREVEGWWSISLNGSSYLRWEYGSDSGVTARTWDGNYVLDKNALLREGIKVDLTPYYLNPDGTKGRRL